VQNGKTPLDMKPLPQFGNGVYELRERFERNAYRLMLRCQPQESGLRAARFHEEIEIRD
jgi:phage-related protein